MPDEDLSSYSNPHSFLSSPLDMVSEVAAPLPAGVTAPPRPLRRERTSTELPVCDPFEIVTQTATPAPPGTLPPPRPNDRVVRVALPVAEPAAGVVADLLARVQTAIDRLNSDPAGLEILRKAAAVLPQAG